MDILKKSEEHVFHEVRKRNQKKQKEGNTKNKTKNRSSRKQIKAKLGSLKSLSGQVINKSDQDQRTG